MKMKNVLITILFLSFYGKLLAQDSRPIPIHISIMDESLSYPNHWFLGYEFNPAVMVGTEFLLKEKRNHDWHLATNLGFFYHKKIESAIFLNMEFGYRIHIKRFAIYPRLGLGYAHTFSPTPIYKPVDGKFEKVKDVGSPTFMPSLALNFSYQLKEEVSSPEIYFTFMSAGEIPFTRYNGLHQFVGFGYKFYLKK